MLITSQLSWLFTEEKLVSILAEDMALAELFAMALVERFVALVARAFVLCCCRLLLLLWRVLSSLLPGLLIVLAPRAAGSFVRCFSSEHAGDVVDVAARARHRAGRRGGGVLYLLHLRRHWVRMRMLLRCYLRCSFMLRCSELRSCLLRHCLRCCSLLRFRC